MEHTEELIEEPRLCRKCKLYKLPTNFTSDKWPEWCNKCVDDKKERRKATYRKRYRKLIAQNPKLNRERWQREKEKYKEYYEKNRE